MKISGLPRGREIEYSAQRDYLLQLIKRKASFDVSEVLVAGFGIGDNAGAKAAGRVVFVLASEPATVTTSDLVRS